VRCGCAWVAALIAAGYTVFAVNPLQVSRYRSRHGVSGAKSDSGDAHVLADAVCRCASAASGGR
jgi:transposase